MLVTAAADRSTRSIWANMTAARSRKRSRVDLLCVAAVANPYAKKQSGVIPCLEIDGGHDRCQEACLNYKISQL